MTDGYKLKIERIKLDKNKRIICISDIHGGYSLFRKLLKKVKYTKDDYLFILGDIIEKGPDNLKTLRYVMKLAKSDNTFVLLGNNDYMAIRILFDEDMESVKKYFNRCRSIYHDFSELLGFNTEGDIDLALLNKKIRERFMDELLFIYNLPTIIETDNMLFAHAGITDYYNMDSLKVRDVIKYDYFMAGNFHLPKRLIVGHYPSVAYNFVDVSLYPITDKEKNITSIDGGYQAKSGGQLNALIFNNEYELKESYYYVDDLVKVRVKKGFTGKKPTVVCIWDREDFKVIKKGETESVCLVDNKLCFIPNELIYDYKGNYHCGDFTDEYLKIRKNEMVGMILKFDNKSMVKKKDKIGFVNNENLYL